LDLLQKGEHAEVVMDLPSAVAGVHAAASTLMRLPLASMRPAGAARGHDGLTSARPGLRSSREGVAASEPRQS